MVTGLSLFAIKKYNEQQRAMEKAITAHEMAEMELQSLRAQLNPHFMFNSLNAIQDLILHEENEKSQLYLKRFSSLLRILLDNASQPFVSLRQELELQKLYLSLEQLRIPNLQYNIEIDPALNLDERMTPNMILQPYLENAVWHGLSNKKGDRKLTLRIMNRNGGTLLQIEDNGIGRKQAAEIKSRYKLGHKSKGMQLLSKRFELLSQEYGAQIKSTITDLEQDGIASGTLVTIELPVSLSEGVIDASINPKNADTYARIAVG
jgi:LytS/YehU family sensor histidine kinase